LPELLLFILLDINFLVCCLTHVSRPGRQIIWLIATFLQSINQYSFISERKVKQNNQ